MKACLRPDIPVVMLTAYGTVGSAVEAMKNGAFDYLTKPADNDELVTVAAKALDQAVLLSENIRLREENARLRLPWWKRLVRKSA